MREKGTLFGSLGAILLTACVGAGIGCQSTTTPEPPTPVKVNLYFEIYNHTQGKITNFERLNVESGSQVSISIGSLPGTMSLTNVVNLSDNETYNGGFLSPLPSGSQSGQYVLETMNVQNINGVDQQRMAIRQDNFGNLVVFSNTGTATFTAPRQNTNYDIILFNATNNAPYQWMDELNSSLYKDKRNYNVFRSDRDGQTGPEDSWASVFDQLNSAIDLGWVKWGYIARQPSGTSGDFSYGFGNSNGNSGWHQGTWITINSMEHPSTYVRIGLAEGFENICQVNNIGGNPSMSTIQTGGILNPVGKDLFAYVFAKDDASKSSSSSTKFSFGFR